MCDVGADIVAVFCEAPVCKQDFSYSVFDPRVTYTMKLLRFSQSGDAALRLQVPSQRCI